MTTRAFDGNAYLRQLAHKGKVVMVEPELEEETRIPSGDQGTRPGSPAYVETLSMDAWIRGAEHGERI